MDYSGYYRQIDACNSRIVQLRRELEGLESFRSDVNRGENEFLEQLGRKRAAATCASKIQNSRIANGFGTSYLRRVGPQFQAGISGSFNGVRAEVMRAIGDIEREMAQQRALIQSTERTIVRMKARERAEEAARKAEEAAKKASS